MISMLDASAIQVLRSTSARGQLLVAKQADFAEIVKAGIEIEELLKQLARAAMAGKKKKIRHLLHMILNSPAAKLSALVRTIRYDADAPPYTLMELLRRVRFLFPYAAIDEEVTLRFKEKHTGEWRPVIDFGWRRRALQQLCADILKVLLPAYSFDFMERGNGGADGAAEHLGSSIKEGKYDFVLTVDIKNCFRSVNKEGIAQLLPLHPKVTNNVVLITGDVTIRKEPPIGVDADAFQHTINEADTAARQGIPQGSSVSSLIMSRAVLGPLLNASPFAKRVIMYGDDIAIPAKSEDEAEVIYKALRFLLENTGPGGPLTIGYHNIWCVENYVNFCKYKLKRTPNIFGADIRYSPSTRGLQRFDQKVKRIYLEATEGEEQVRVAKYVTAWKKAYPHWHPNEIAEDAIAMATDMATHEAWKVKSAKCCPVGDAVPLVQSIAQEAWS